MSTATLPSHPRAVQAPSRVDQRFITADVEVFRNNLNRLPFEVSHTLAGHPLFELPRLVQLALDVSARKSPHRKFGDAYCLIGTPQPGQKTLEGAQPVSNVAETISQIENSNGWIMLNHVERDPEYSQVLEQSICDVLELSGREIRNKIKWFEAIVFVTSPHRVTSYHVDRECAWLLQLRGDKEIHLFDRADRDVVPEEELERFWAVDNQAGVYKPQFEDRALLYDMKPGTGVHIPVNTPHWLKNGAEVSVSMNINFVFHDRYWGNIYKANHYLRSRGLNPTPPGHSKLIDGAKGLAYTALQRVNERLKKRVHIPEEARVQRSAIFKNMEGRW